MDAPQERDGDKLLPPGEVARLFGVDPHTIGEWARAGKIGFRLTLGGKRRYFESEVRALIADQQAVA